VVGAWEVLEEKVTTGENVAIVGGGAVGVETALFLAEKGTMPAETLKFLLVNNAEPVETLLEMATRGSKKICLIEMTDRIGKDIGKSTKWGMMQDLGRFGVESITAGKVVKITQTGLEIDQNGDRVDMAADTVVIAAGSASFNPLESVVKEMGIDYRVIGDAVQIGMAFDAVHAGYEVGNAI